MKVFHCDHCGNLLFFENVQCLTCGRALGFVPEGGDLSALEPAGNGLQRALSAVARGRLHRLCRNGAQHQVCNWMVPSEDPNPYCRSCRLNEVIPDLNVWGNLERWRKLEAAKRRILYTLMRLGLSMEGVPSENRPALRFRFLGNPVFGPLPMTGHSRGVITVNITEADDEQRERLRIRLREPYRTLLGHLRHEIAHHYWDQLISSTPRLTRFRQLFGNEELNYDAALWTYYQQGPRAGWQDRYISAYASAHPWEDWAECWAHYLHIVDTVESAASYGIALRPTHPDARSMTAEPKQVAEPDTPIGKILEYWLPLTRALNSLNRGMGLPDLYPFVLSAPVIEKLQFIQEVVQSVSPKVRGPAPGAPAELPRIPPIGICRENKIPSNLVTGSP